MSDYLKSAVCDFVLLAVMSMALCYIALDGFYVSEGLQHSVVPAVIALVCSAALLVLARDKRAARIGGIAYGVCLLVAWIVAGALTPGGAIFTDNESNYLIFCMVTTIIPTLCFLVTRKRTGAALLFVAGVLFAAVLQLLYQRFEVVWVVLFVIATLAMIIFKNYQQSLRTATTVRSASALPGLGAALGAAVLAAGLGAGIWYGVIAPMNPSALEIKLVTEYRALETKQVVGTSNVFQTPNTDLKSNMTNDGVRTTDDIKESVDGTPWPATGKEKEQEDKTQESTFVGIDLDSLQDMFDLQQNPSVMPLMLGIIAAIIALIAGYFVGRRLWRERRLRKLQSMGPDAEYEGLFLLLLKKFERIGIKVPAGQTIMEFGNSSKSTMSAYSQQAGVDFSTLATEYCAITYGAHSADEQSLKGIETFYRSFWKACRKELGNFKYFIKSFRL